MIWLSVLAKLWKPALLLVAAGFLWFRVSAWYDDYLETKRIYDDRLTVLTRERNNASLELQTLKYAMQEQQRNAKRVELLSRIAKRENIIIQRQMQRHQAAFKGHDLEKAATRHEKWIEKLANNATKERMDALENLFNQ